MWLVRACHVFLTATAPSCLDPPTASYMRVRKILEADPRRHMSRQEATKVCTSCGMSVEEADKLLGKLHDVGAILYFKNVRLCVPPCRAHS